MISFFLEIWLIKHIFQISISIRVGILRNNRYFRPIFAYKNPVPGFRLQKVAQTVGFFCNRYPFRASQHNSRYVRYSRSRYVTILVIGEILLRSRCFYVLVIGLESFEVINYIVSIMNLWVHMFHTVVVHGRSGLFVSIVGLWLVTCDYCSCMCGCLAHTKVVPILELGKCSVSFRDVGRIPAGPSLLAQCASIVTIVGPAYVRCFLLCLLYVVELS